ncbi:hypothetical protein Tco_1227232 [Tanacetum coccineum]
MGTMHERGEAEETLVGGPAGDTDVQIVHVYLGIRAKRLIEPLELVPLQSFPQIAGARPAHPGNDSVGGRSQAAEEHRTVARCPVSKVNSSGRWNNVVKGKLQNGIRNLGKRIALRAGTGAQFRTRRLSAAARAAHAARAGQPRAGRGTDCPALAMVPRCNLNVISAIASECQSDEIQPSADPTVPVYIPAKPHQGNGLAESAGKEDPVGLDSSPTFVKCFRV